MKLQKNSLRSWTPQYLTLTSAILVIASFPPWNCWLLIWVCLIPWYIAIQKTSSLKDSLIQGLWFNYFITLGGFYWIAYVLREFGNLNWVISVLGLQIFCLIGQPQLIVFSPLLKWIESKKSNKKQSFINRPVFLGVVTSLLFSGLDWILPKLFLDTLGHSLYRAKHLRQLADLGGVHLLTFLIFFINHAIWKLFEMWKKTKKLKFNSQFKLAGIFIALAWCYGFYRLDFITKKMMNPQQFLQGAAIQANIGDFDKVAAEQGITSAATKILDTLISMSDRALLKNPKPDFIVWPETSYPTTFRNPHTFQEMQLDESLEIYLSQIEVPFLFGGYDYFNQKDHNAFFFLSPNENLQVYRKSILLLFGEYIPGAEFFPIIKDLFPQVGNFGRGKGPQVFSINIRSNNTNTQNSIFVGPMICYEGLFPKFSIDLAKQGSQFLLNITNDSWFGKWGEPQLHLALTIFRSIETRLPMLRSTNTGISALILPDGEIKQPTEIDSQTILSVKIPILEYIPTIIKKWGDWFGLFSFVFGMLGLFFFQSKKLTAGVLLKKIFFGSKSKSSRSKRNFLEY